MLPLAGGVVSLHSHGQPPTELRKSAVRAEGPRRPGEETHGEGKGRGWGEGRAQPTAAGTRAARCVPRITADPGGQRRAVSHLRRVPPRVRVRTSPAGVRMVRRPSWCFQTQPVREP